MGDTVLEERIQGIMDKFDEIMIAILDAIDRAFEWLSKQIKRFW